MRPVTTAVRQNLNRAVIAAGRCINRTSGGRFPLSVFSGSIVPEKINTDVRIISEDDCSTTIAKVGKDGKIKNTDFKIMSTTDLHFGNKPELLSKTFRLLAKNISIEKPDLVIFTGDIVLSRFQQLDAIQFAQFMEKTGVYWAIVFGNHEAREEKGYFKYLMMKSMSDYPHCLSKLGDHSLYGYGNFAVNIMNGENSMQQCLFFFDSGRDIRDECRDSYGIPKTMKGYDFLKREQIEWYKSYIDTLTSKYGDVKSMMYMHIPLPEYGRIINPDGNGGFEPSGEGEILYGAAHESVGCSPYNSGMFDAIVEKGSTNAVFSGHDHVNDFCAKYKNVYLVYNQPGGYETYDLGSVMGLPEEQWQYGVTVTLVRPDGSVNISQRLNSRFLRNI